MTRTESGQLGGQLLGQCPVLLAEEALVHGEHDKPVSDRPGASPNRGNSLDKIKNREGSFPLHGSLNFLSTGEQVLAADRQQSLHNLVHVAASQPGVGDDSQRLAQQRG